jgi:SAM-dependent methyltransferase
MTTPAPPQWTDVLRHITPAFPAVAVVAAMALDLFSPLAAGPRTAEELAAALGVPVRPLRLLLGTLVPTGLVVAEGERYANGPAAAEYLVKGRPGYMGGSHELYSGMFAAVQATVQSVRTGAPQALKDWDRMPDEELRAFLRGLNPAASAQGRALAQERDFSRFRSLLDVGGGGGGLAVGACRVCPGLSAQVVELPRVARISRELIAAEGLGERVQAVAHDMTAAPLPGEHDAAVLRNVIQVLGPDAAQRLLANVARSLRPGGELFLLGQVLDDDRAGPPAVLALNLFFLNVFPEGEAYTEAEHRRWLAAAGFIEVTRHLLPTQHSLLAARRAGA